jgi:FtsP/CotA-like multicopper oxidase with cupredoxin domain
MLSRRNFLTGSAIALVSATAVSGRAQAAAIPEAPTTTSPAMQPPVSPPEGQAYQPVVTLNGWTLPWRMNGEWKEFHLVAEEVEREIAPGMTARLWGYNGQTPGPTIEAVEGDKVRIFVTNKLPEHTTVHWHGMLLPNGMDGVGGLTQPHIPVGKTFVYEFELKGSGTFMYHPHSDEMVQMAMGMMGSFVVHPKDPGFRRVDRDFAFAERGRFDQEPFANALRCRLYLTSMPRLSGDRCLAGQARRPGAHQDRQSHHDRPPDPSARPSFRGRLHRRRLGAGERAMAGGDGRCAGGLDPRHRVRRRRAGRLGLSLPQVASHHERHGT